VIATPTLVLLLIGAPVLIGFGSALAVMRRANSDYKKTKAALPGMRRDFWATWRAMMKLAFFVVFGFLVMAAWAAHEIRDSDRAPASPSSPRPAITDRWVVRR
jgi:hypothetical protein